MSRRLCLALILGCLIANLIAPSARANEPVVRAVLFYSPTCGHCHYVINEVLPQIFEQYAMRLQIVGVNVAESGGQTLYQAAVEHFQIPAERRGVPTLIVAEVVLVGSVEIPEQLPGLIEHYLAEGGVDWPDVPGLAEALFAAQAPTPLPSAPSTSAAATGLPDTPSPAPTAAAPDPSSAAPTPPARASPAETRASVLPSPTEAATSPTSAAGFVAPIASPAAALGVIDRIALDPQGNGLAVLVLLGLLAVLGWVIQSVWTGNSGRLPHRAWRSPLTLALAVSGLAVAGYLAYVETQNIAAVCGPVGDCNTVQQSAYARLFGVLPIGVLGMAGYAVILVAWGIARRPRGRWSDLALAGLWVMSLAGTLFSTYLTFLEPFVIGATCAWCLTSAILMAALVWLTAAPGSAALARVARWRGHRRAGARR
jgi:uncharacterized membrane protein